MYILRAIQIILAVMGVYIFISVVREYRKNPGEQIPVHQKVANALIGFIFQGLDALGIGSFAPTMAALKLTRSTSDVLIPGTLNVGGSIPVIIEAIAFITVIKVDITTFILLTVVCIIGSLVGAKLTNIFPENIIKTFMGAGLMIAGILMVMSKFNLMPLGGDNIGLTGVKLVIGMVVNFVLGVLLPLGIGNYAPMMCLVYMLGMNAQVAFPLMMTDAAFGLASGSIGFIKAKNYNVRAALSIEVFGAVGVLVAVYIVKSMPLNVLQWLIIVVVFYTSITLLKQAASWKSRKKEAAKA